MITVSVTGTISNRSPVRWIRQSSWSRWNKNGNISRNKNRNIYRVVIMARLLLDDSIGDIGGSVLLGMVVVGLVYYMINRNSRCCVVDV